MAARWLKVLVAAPLMVASLTGGPAKALVPYVVVPSERKLEAAGLGIAQAASRLLKLGQAEEAASLAALTVQLIPTDARGWLLLAEAQLRSGEDAEASASLEQARNLDPRNAGILFAQGSLALKANQPARAVELIREGQRIDDKNAGSYFDLGNGYILLGKTKSALSAFEQASKLRSDFWEAINNQSLVLYEQRKDAEAIKRFRSVLAIRPNEPEPMLGLAAAINAQKPGNEESLDLAKRALAGNPNYVLNSYQKEQLWGSRLRQDTSVLLENASLKSDVDRAQANADAEPVEEPR